MTIFKKITKIIWDILAVLVVVILAAMLLILTWQVFSRYVLKNSSGWTSEVTTALFVWASMLGSAVAVKAGGHVAMTMLINKLKGKVHTVAKMVVMLICEVFFFIIFRGGLIMMDKFSKTVTSHLRIPMPAIYVSFVIAGACMLIFGLEWIISYIIELVKARENDPMGGDE